MTEKFLTISSEIEEVFSTNEFLKDYESRIVARDYEVSLYCSYCNSYIFEKLSSIITEHNLIWSVSLETETFSHFRIDFYPNP